MSGRGWNDEDIVDELHHIIKDENQPSRRTNDVRCYLRRDVYQVVDMLDIDRWLPLLRELAENNQIVDAVTVHIASDRKFS